MISAAKMRQDLLARKKLRSKRAGGGGSDFPFRVAKVTEVDPRRMILSLMTLTGNEDLYTNVPLTFPGGGSRHFMGAIPDVNDLCVIGYAPAESGMSRFPYIVGWIIPGVEASYDWMMVSLTREKELEMSPKIREAIRGTIGRTRKKLRQMEVGNIVASSSQGSDLILNESVTLANRRGNELILRDQDQAIVTRSLQMFHAGAGVRTYSGMVQRDNALLPTQTWQSATDWSGPRQIDAEGSPLSRDELDATPFDADSALYGELYTPSDVFNSGLSMGDADPREFLKRGLYIDDRGRLFDQKPKGGSVYGGKRFYRVSTDLSDGVPDPGSEVFSEFRVEVSHTSDGTLPVTEQTDGIDIDRLLPNTPQRDANGEIAPNKANRSPNAPMVSLILGTAVGSDPVGDRSTYGKPLVAQLYDASGKLAPQIRAAADGESPESHAAYLLRVANPYDPNQAEAFMAVTKGGALRSYFPGSGSESHQEFYNTGKKVVLGAEGSGASSVLEADGMVSIQNTGKGQAVDNVGISLGSQGGAVRIFAGGTKTGAEEGGAGSDTLDTNQNTGLWLESSNNALFRSAKKAKIQAPEIRLTDADGITVDASSTVNVSSGSKYALSAKAVERTINGQENNTYGGALDGNLTNGPTRSTKFTGTPLTGVGSVFVDAYESNFGGSKAKYNAGKVLHQILIGSFSAESMVKPSIITLPFPGASSAISCGYLFTKNEVKAKLLGVDVSASVGPVKVEAKKGTVSLTGSLGVTLKTPAKMRLQASLISVSCLTSVVRGGGVLTSGCRNPLTGRKFNRSGVRGVAGFKVGL